MNPSAIAVLVTGRGERLRRLAVERLRSLDIAVFDDAGALPSSATVVRLDAGVVADPESLREAAAATRARGRAATYGALDGEGVAATIVPPGGEPAAAPVEDATIGRWLPASQEFSDLEGPAAAVFYGMLWGATGYAAVGRNLMVGLTARGVPTAGRNVWWSEGNFSPVTARERALLQSAERMPSTMETPAILMRPAGDRGGVASISDFAVSRTRGPAIAYTMFECDGIPARWVRALAEFENVWVPSRFNLHTFAESGVPQERLRLVPIGIDAPAFEPDGPRLELPGRRRFAFLSVFDWNERKGPDVLLRAWAAAFGPDDDVVLYLRTGKSTVGAPGGPLDQARALGLDLARMAPIEIITDDLPGVEYAALFRSVDAFVLTSRGEAFCIPLLEAMAAGLPTIGTGYGGSADFLDDTTGYPIPARLAPVSLTMARRIPFYARLRWADPSVEATAGAMQSVVSDSVTARRRAAHGFARAQLLFDRRRTAGKAVEALAEARPPRRSVHAVGAAMLWGPAREGGAAGQATRALLLGLEASGIAVRLVDGGKRDEDLDPTLSRTLRRAERLAPDDGQDAAISVDALVPGARAVFLTAAPADLTPLQRVETIWTAEEAVERELIARGIAPGTVRRLTLPVDDTLYTPDAAVAPAETLPIVYVAPEPRRIDALTGFARAVRAGDPVVLALAPSPESPTSSERVRTELSIAMRLAGVTQWSPRITAIEAPATSRRAIAAIASASLAIAADPQWPGHDLTRACGVAVVDAADVDLVRRLLADPDACARLGSAARREARARSRYAAAELGHAFADIANLAGPQERTIRPTRILLVVDDGLPDAERVVADLRRDARHELVDATAPLGDLDYVVRVAGAVQAPPSWDEILINALSSRGVAVAESFDWSELESHYPAGSTYTQIVSTAALSFSCESGIRAQTASGALRMMRAADATATGPVWRCVACVVTPFAGTAAPFTSVANPTRFGAGVGLSAATPRS